MSSRPIAALVVMASNLISSAVPIWLSVSSAVDESDGVALLSRIEGIRSMTDVRL
jgi:hypothetical protein